MKRAFILVWDLWDRGRVYMLYVLCFFVVVWSERGGVSTVGNRLGLMGIWEYDYYRGKCIKWT